MSYNLKDLGISQFETITMIITELNRRNKFGIEITNDLIKNTIDKHLKEIGELANKEIDLVSKETTDIYFIVKNHFEIFAKNNSQQNMK